MELEGINNKIKLGYIYIIQIMSMIDIGSVENLKLNEDSSKEFNKEYSLEFEFKLLDVGSVSF